MKPNEPVSIPAYYKNKKKREEITAHIEGLTRQIMEAMVSNKNDLELNKALMGLFSIDYKPKFLDDTRFVVVSRYHVAITALAWWQKKGKDKTPRQLIHPATIEKVVKFIKSTYLPMCEHLMTNLFHKYSNHGAIACAGKIIALKYLIEYDDSLTPWGRSTIEYKLKKMPKVLEKRAKRAISRKDGWFAKKGEIAVENLRNKSGLFYTYLHLSYLFRAMVSLDNSNYKPTGKTKEILRIGYDKYAEYFVEPQKWKYLDRTKIPILRQLQQLIFPSGKEFREPRPHFKEGAFMYFVYMEIYPTTGLPHSPPYLFEDLGPFPYASIFTLDEFELFKIL
jgi:hypothetical protein